MSQITDNKDMSLNNTKDESNSTSIEQATEIKSEQNEDSKDDNENQKKKFKTAKDRRINFMKNKMKDWDHSNEGRVKSDEPRKPKKKVALLMGFSGANYQGMQVNPGAKTIEQDLFDALCKIGAVSKDNSDDIRKVGFMRAARTDKGVSAAGQVVSFKMIIEDDTIKNLNEALPDEIEVFGYVRTQKSFHAKNLCDSRVYEYLLPTYVFTPPKTYPKVDVTNPKDMPPCTPQEIEEFYQFRLTQDMLQRIQEALDLYKGTHNFHNFTIKRQFSEQASNRFIHSFKISQPFIRDGLEWVSLKVHGQSFMMHQIRKMIAMVIMVVRSETPIDIIQKAFGDVKISIPKVPGLGLLLEKPVYDIYNKKMKDKQETGELGELSFTPYEEEMEAFKHKMIYPTIYKVEKGEKVFAEFIKSVDCYKEHFTYLNKEGILYARTEESKDSNGVLSQDEDEDERED
ncbi:pseudouridine synthase [Neoconidiobolus thromboides FSU 785]|nr:pseudouridine synthase [Neoconidiobolus thromboides FSU 785]